MRPIDADALYEKVTDEIYKFYNDVGGGYWLAEDVLEEIDSAPTIDAEEIYKDVNSGIGCSSCPYFEMKSSSCLAELLSDVYNLLKVEVEQDDSKR